jgi:hypothetical protein
LTFGVVRGTVVAWMRYSTTSVQSFAFSVIVAVDGSGWRDGQSLWTTELIWRAQVAVGCGVLTLSLVGRSEDVGGDVGREGMLSRAWTFD